MCCVIGLSPLHTFSLFSLYSTETAVQVGDSGFSWGATFIGFAVAGFLTLVFLTIVGAIVAGIGYQMGARAPTVGGALSATSRTLGLGGLVGALIAVALAYGLGGYTAGRMARCDGAKNGVRASCSGP